MSCGTCGIQAAETMAGDTGVPPGAPTSRQARCPRCKAFLAADGGMCRNPRCPVGRESPVVAQLVAQVTALLNDRYPDVGREAVRVLGRLGGSAALRALQEAARDPAYTLEIRSDALQALGRWGGPAAEAAITAASQDSGAFLREAAVRAAALLEQGGGVRESLLRAALRDPVADVREEAVAQLAEAAGDRAIADLTPLLMDPNRMVQATTVAQLGQLASPLAIPALQAALTTAPTPQQREAIVIALGQIGGPATVPALALAAQDAAASVRQTAVRLLGRVADPARVPVLAQALRDDSSGVRQAAVSALSGVTPVDAVPLLRTVLHDPNPQVRCQAGGLLLGLAGAAALPAIQPLLADAEAAVRHALVKELPGVGEPAASQALVPLLQDESVAVRREVVNALGALGHQEGLVQALSDRIPLIRQAAVQELQRVGRYDPPTTAALASLLADPATDVQVAAIAALGSGAASPAQIAALLAPLLADPRRHFVCRAALRSLGLLAAREPTARAVLSRVLAESPHRDMRRGAAQALASQEGEEIALALAPYLLDDDEEVRQTAAAALVRHSGPLAYAALSTAAGPTSAAPVRLTATAALGQLGGAPAVPALTRILQQDGDSAVRQAAAEGLGRCADAAAVPALVAAVRDRHLPLREKAVVALGNIGGAEATVALGERATKDRTKTIRLLAVRALGQAQAEATTARPVLAQALTDEHGAVREAAIEALWTRGRAGDRTVRPLLEETMLDNGWEGARSRAVRAVADLTAPEKAPRTLALGLADTAPQVRQAVVEAISRLGPDQVAVVAAQLTAIVQADPAVDVRRAGIAALEQLDPAQAVPAIAPALSDRSPSVRDLALVALHRLGGSDAARSLAAYLTTTAETSRLAAVRALGGAAHGLGRSPRAGSANQQQPPGA